MSLYKNLILFLSLFVPCLLNAQAFRLTGRVIDETGKPLNAATVYLKSTNYAVNTSENGAFAFKGIPAGTYLLSASHLGFVTQELDLILSADTSLGTLVLESMAKELSEVSITNEKQTRVQETKPITISSIQIKDVATQNMLLTDVVDRISGVRIRRSSSLGDGSDISINGIRGNGIRIYIDGLPMEFVYPRFDISTLPLGDVKRLDVYKGVLPVDVGTDAMGGGINIVTDQKSHNHFRASYTVGSFNTHLADAALSLTNSKNYFINFSGAFHYSANNYGMDAMIFEKNRRERVRRFHDAYQTSFGGISFGVHSKSWADELRITLNASRGYKEMMNGARVTNIAIGEAEYKANNLAGTIKYEKALAQEKIKLSTIGNYSRQLLQYVDTTRNVYSWSGQLVGRRNSRGEYAAGHSDTYTNAWVNRTTASYLIAAKHRLLFSNLYARQRLHGTDFLETPENDDLRTPRYLTKNIAGAQYEGLFYRKLTIAAAVKRFDFILIGIENRSRSQIRKQDGIWGGNLALKYDFSDDFFVRTSFEKGFLIPQFFQYVGNGADIIQNTDLRPESSDNLNLGLFIRRPITRTLQLASTVNSFYRQQYDIIFLGDGVVRRFQNADQVRTIGLEGDITLAHSAGVSLKMSATAMRKTFTAVLGNENQYLVGSTFPNNPPFFANAELSWESRGTSQKQNRLRTYFFYHYITRFNHILVGADNSPTTTPSAYVPVQHRVDTGVSYKLATSGLTASVNVLNLFNAELYDNFLVPRAGISFNAKVIYELSNF